MKFENVCIESLAVALPDEVWTSAQIEERLRPLYERLKLPEGRLELMTGIRERRMWPEGTRAAEASPAAGRPGADLRCVERVSRILECADDRRRADRSGPHRLRVDRGGRAGSVAGRTD